MLGSNSERHCVCVLHAAELGHAEMLAGLCLNVAHDVLHVLAGKNSSQHCSRQPSARDCLPFVSVSAFAEACSSLLSTVGLWEQALVAEPCCAAHCSFGLWALTSGRLGTVGQHRGTHTHTHTRQT